MIGQPQASGSASIALAAAVSALLRHFHRQSPIRGGSLLITIFGDSIAPRGGAITLRSLIDLAQPFALAERLVRTSVARLARDGWLVTHRIGRRSEYRLTPTGQQRFAEATRRIYGEIPRSWDGHWTLLVLPSVAGPGRQDLRHELRWLGFGQISPGVFAHPNSSIEEARAELSGLEGAAQALLFQTSSEGCDADTRLAATGWDLDELARRYQRFLDTFAPVTEAVMACPPAGLDPQAAFVIRTLLIHEYRKIHLQDPLLPAALLPPDWIGTAAYELSKRLYSAVFRAAEGYISNMARTLTEPLPSPDSSAYGRFGGVGAAAEPAARPPA
jgi:phenylacetic acid degradation operon negative regulatory protein